MSCILCGCHEEAVPTNEVVPSWICLDCAVEIPQCAFCAAALTKPGYRVGLSGFYCSFDCYEKDRRETLAIDEMGYRSDEMETL